MKYFGGKNRSGKKISEVIQPFIGDKDFYSLFTGSGGVEQHIKAKNKYYNDLHFTLKILYDSMINGWKPSKEDFETRYGFDCVAEYYTTFQNWYNENIKPMRSDVYSDCPYKTLFAFGCSFGGKFNSGFSRDKRNDIYTLPAMNLLMKKIKNGLIENLRSFTTLDYREYSHIKNSVFYLDPPYANTTKYTTGGFNSLEFWDFVRELSQNNIVFISEYIAPSDFDIVYEFDFTRGMRDNDIGILTKNIKKERIFMFSKTKEKHDDLQETI